MQVEQNARHEAQTLPERRNPRMFGKERKDEDVDDADDVERK